MRLEALSALGVDDFSVRFAQWLSVRSPELLERLELDPKSDRTNRTLFAKFESPISGLPAIELTTCGEEITLFFDRWHSHFAFFSEIPDEEGFEQALQWLEALQEERAGVAISMVGEQWKGSQSWRPGEELPTAPLHGHVYVRSWRGTYNHD